MDLRRGELLIYQRDIWIKTCWEWDFQVKSLYLNIFKFFKTYNKYFACSLRGEVEKIIYGDSWDY